MPSTLLAQAPPFNTVDCPWVDFPAFVPDSLLHLSISTSQQIPTFPPLMCDSIVHIPVMENGAKETLISGSGQSNRHLIDVLPAVLTNVSTESSGVLVSGSRGLCGGTRDVNAIASGIAAISLVSTSLRYSRHPNFVGTCCTDDEDVIFSDTMKQNCVQ